MVLTDISGAIALKPFAVGSTATARFCFALMPPTPVKNFRPYEERILIDQCAAAPTSSICSTEVWKIFSHGALIHL